MGSGDKKTAKGRLDKYYYLAKDQGFRARSAFKLLHLNKKYDFLSNAHILIDLCAAPGGWLQVASKYMAPGNQNLIIGVDLVKIKPIPNVITIVADITTEQCRSMLKKHMQTAKADVVLHDGAPNVGANWAHDSYTQAELVMSATKLACEMLVPGGTFVSKVFRSREYNNVMNALTPLFKKVEATKPASSRNVSAEIFVICRGYLGKFDAASLDPKIVFAEAKGNSTNLTKIDILHPDKKQRHREGYEDNATMLYKTVTAEEFISSPDPVQILGTVNKINFGENSPDANQDIKSFCEDLRVIGRREFNSILKWRRKIVKAKELEEKRIKDEQAKKEEEENGKQEIDPLNDLDELIQKQEKLKKNVKRRKKEEKEKLKKRMRQLDSADFDITETELFSIENLERPSSTTTATTATTTLKTKQKQQQEKKESPSSSSSEESQDEQNMMDKELEQDYERFRERRIQREQEEKEKFEESFFKDPAFQILKEASQAAKEKKKPSTTTTIDDSNSDGENHHHQKSSKSKNKKNSKNLPKKEEIVFVPVEQKYDEEMKELLLDQDSISAAVTLAKNKKSQREKLIDESFNRYAFGDKPEDLPSWFVEEEKRHSAIQKPLTKEAVAAIKDKLKRIAEQPSKKVVEARNRNKMRAIKKLETLKKKAAIIARSEDMDGKQKSIQIEKIMKKSTKPTKKKKALVIAKGSKKGLKGRPKGVKGHYKMVDRRLKKDQSRKNNSSSSSSSKNKHKKPRKGKSRA